MLPPPTLVVVTIRDVPRAQRATTEWSGMTYIHTGAELLLGISFIVTVVFAALGVVEHHRSIVAEVAAIAFICSLAAVLLDWVTATDEDPRGWD